MSDKTKILLVIIVFVSIFLAVAIADYDDPSGEDLDAYVGEHDEGGISGLGSSEDFCDVEDVEVEVRYGNDHSEDYGWFSLEEEDSEDCVEFYDVHDVEDNEETQDPDYDDVDHESLASESTWETGEWYEHCPYEGSYDARMRGDLEMDDGDYVNVESDWFEDVYTVDFHSNNWCELCRGEEWIGEYEEDEIPEFIEEDSLGCCMEDHPDYDEPLTWGNYGTYEDEACVKGEAVEEGPAENNPEYLVSDGRIHYCKVPGEEERHDFSDQVVEKRYECGYETTETGEYYCGAYEPDKDEDFEHQGMWKPLDESGCDQIVRRIRDGRVQVN